MYTVDLKDSLSTSNNLIFINKDTEKFIHVDLNIVGEKIEAVISKSDDGINLQFPVVNDPAVDSLPILTGNMVNASLTVINHFKANGFKLTDTITSNKDGLKFR